MLLDKEIKILVNNSTAEYYENLGYEVPRYIGARKELRVKRGTKIIVKIEDLNPKSNIKVNVECDYCGKKYAIPYATYLKAVVNGEIKKVACFGKCSQKKLEESNMSRYGVATPTQRPDVDKKIKATMKERYGCEYAAQNKEINKKASMKKMMKVEDVYSKFTEKNLIPMFRPNQYKGVFERLPFICRKHGNVIQYITLELLSKSPLGCEICGRESKRGENHYMWQGGTSHLQQYLRAYLIDWKRDSLVKYNYKCGLSGDEVEAIHHLYGFNQILKEILSNLNLPIHQDISKYTDEELRSIIQECKTLHKKYGLGIPLSKSIHSKFHEIYGRGNNTPEQFQEFKQRYLAGEFTDL